MTLRTFLVSLACSLPLAAQAFDLQGHRGARGLAPENTLPAFAAALSIGVTTLELDVGVTRDGVVVVHHDRTLNPAIARGPDGRWLEQRGPAIYSLSYEELQRFDLGRLNPGSDYARPFTAQQPADGARAPKLAVVQAEAPDIATVYLTGQKFADAPRKVAQAGGRIWSPNFNAVDAERMKEARALGLQVVVWTVNEPAQIAAMLALGVDGIISDRPDLVREEMSRRGMKLPQPTPVLP